MSTQPKTTPMNISPQNIAGTCNYKCAFSFDYPVKYYEYILYYLMALYIYLFI